VADAFATALIAVLDGRGHEQQDRALADINARLKTLQDGIRRLDAQIGSTPLAAQSVPIAQRDALVRQYSVVYEQLQQITTQPGAISGLTVLQNGDPHAVNRGLQPPQTRTGRALFAGLLALIVGGGLALVLDRLDQGVRNRSMAETAFGVPVLAEIPPLPLSARKGTPLLTDSRPNSTVAEAYRTLRTSLLLMHEQAVTVAHGESNGQVGVHDQLHVVMVSSPNPSEGKSTTAANLAVTFAEAGKSVLVIDCDFRHPRVHRYLGADEGPGLSEVLLGGARAPSLRQVMRPTQVPGVQVVTSGAAVDNPSELFARGHDAIAAARDLADVIILDTPPVLVINDAIEISPIADAVLLVCRSGRTTMEEAGRASEVLTRVGAPLAGVVVIGSTEAPTNKSSYYYYYYRSEQNTGGGLLRRLRHGNRRPRPVEATTGRARPPAAPSKQKAQQPKGNDKQKGKAAKGGAGKGAGQPKQQQPAPNLPPIEPQPTPRPPAAAVAPVAPSPAPPAPPAAAPAQPSPQPRADNPAAFAPKPAPPSAPAQGAAPTAPRPPQPAPQPSAPAQQPAAPPSAPAQQPAPQPTASSQPAPKPESDPWAPETIPVMPGFDEIDLGDPDGAALADTGPEDVFRQP
jgi:capsular exopolysaccharide synthesis family protein